MFLSVLSQFVDLLEFSAFPIAVSGCFFPVIIVGQHEKRPPAVISMPVGVFDAQIFVVYRLLVSILQSLLLFLLLYPGVEFL